MSEIYDHIIKGIPSRAIELVWDWPDGEPFEYKKKSLLVIAIKSGIPELALEMLKRPELCIIETDKSNAFMHAATYSAKGDYRVIDKLLEFPDMFGLGNTIKKSHTSTVCDY